MIQDKRYLVDSCPFTQSCMLFKSKWSYPLLLELQRHEQSTTFTGLAHALAPITPRMLSKGIKTFSGQGILEKNQKNYLLTAKGRNFSEKIRELRKELVRGSVVCLGCRGIAGCIKQDEYMPHHS